MHSSLDSTSTTIDAAHAPVASHAPAIQARTAEIVATAKRILRDLVAFPTISRQPNLPLITYIRDYLESQGITSRLVAHADGTRANLYATIGPTDRGGICLSGHADVVPVTGQPWTSDPFTLIERDGLLVGRGAADMKGYIACVLACVPFFKDTINAIPLHIAVSYDEEIGCVGIRDLLAELAVDAAKPIGCIIGEPTGMRVAMAHKGKHSYRCGVRGLAGHSSQPETGVNAIEYAAELVSHLRGIGAGIRRDGPFNDAFAPSYTTIQTGTIRGGVAVNVVPDQCDFDFEIRYLPEDSADTHVAKLKAFALKQLLADMQATYNGADIAFTQLSAYPGLRNDNDAPARQLKSLCSHALGFAALADHTVAFGTEGGLYQEIGVPTLICGPGSIDQAHKADEFVAISQMEACCVFLQRLANGLARD
ncbi:acetylornithine deacetylase [Robbsia andropogonis]|uniref:acetylornithine deacetylase n=1 Tax=Robbsia andropogonis TaxID=28092 RepID=UPI0004640089|nr:acetylornithine deacetylase [Robbsia andropogonis]MCP1117787.1 acetylornithine deacetylase [Robbsia andropogonis]MCP1127252.1 acetylornithine deacetylase [Robbsia andropogonis]